MCPIRSTPNNKVVITRCLACHVNLPFSCKSNSNVQHIEERRFYTIVRAVFMTKAHHTLFTFHLWTPLQWYVIMMTVLSFHLSMLALFSLWWWSCVCNFVVQSATYLPATKSGVYSNARYNCSTCYLVTQMVPVWFQVYVSNAFFKFYYFYLRISSIIEPNFLQPTLAETALN